MKLETPRCVLREIDPLADAEPLFAMNGDPEVMRYTGDTNYPSIDATREAYERYRREVYDVTGFGRWTILDKETGRFLGWCGLRRIDGEIDIGYRLARAEWGRGIATECAGACLAWGFDTLALDRIVARVHPENRRSIRVLEKLGLTFVRESTLGDLPALAYEIRRARFLQSNFR